MDTKTDVDWKFLALKHKKLDIRKRGRGLESTGLVTRKETLFNLQTQLD